MNSKSSRDLDDSEEYEFTEVHTNPPFYDFKNAEVALGVKFEFICENGFDEFIKEKYLELLPLLRKCYQKKDFKMVDEHAHKIKGAFVYITSTFVSESANILMTSARCKNVEMIEDLYIDLLVKMNIFLEKLIDFTKVTNNPIKSDFLKNYLKLMNELDSKESSQMRAKYQSHEKKIKYDIESGKYLSKKVDIVTGNNNITSDNFKHENNEEIIFESRNSGKDCCRISDCLIF